MQQIAAHSFETYLSLFFKTIIDNVFKLLYLFSTDSAQLVSELTIFIDELLDHVHLFIQLGEFCICQRLGICELIVKTANFG